MKKTFFLLIATLFLAVSCKKEGIKVTQFTAGKADGQLIMTQFHTQ
jgi:hypothetical protein